ncbi:DUF443 family protein [Staphylococcus aureus]
MSFEVSKNVLHIKLKGCGDIGLRGIVIYKNPKYRIIKYNDDILMVNIINNWLVLFIPLLNWLTPKRYINIFSSKNNYKV